MGVSKHTENRNTSRSLVDDIPLLVAGRRGIHDSFPNALAVGTLGVTKSATPHYFLNMKLLYVYA